MRNANRPARAVALPKDRTSLVEPAIAFVTAMFLSWLALSA